MQKIIKTLYHGSIVWIVIFIVDSIYTLYQMNESGVKTTFSGLRIATVITTDELNTTFTLTLQAIWMYLLFISIWILLFSLSLLKKRYYGHDME